MIDGVGNDAARAAGVKGEGSRECIGEEEKEGVIITGMVFSGGALFLFFGFFCYVCTPYVLRIDMYVVQECPITVDAKLTPGLVSAP